MAIRYLNTIILLTKLRSDFLSPARCINFAIFQCRVLLHFAEKKKSSLNRKINRKSSYVLSGAASRIVIYYHIRWFIWDELHEGGDSEGMGERGGGGPRDRGRVMEGVGDMVLALRKIYTPENRLSSPGIYMRRIEYHAHRFGSDASHSYSYHHYWPSPWRQGVGGCDVTDDGLGAVPLSPPYNAR